MAAPRTILPAPEQLHLIPLMATATEITAVVETSAASAPCPRCGHSSRRVPARDVRSVADVPWHGVPFRLRLHVRRFFCAQPTWARAICAERLPGRIAPQARRTARLDAWRRAVGGAVGGAAGTRRLQARGRVASPDTPRRHGRRRWGRPARPAVGGDPGGSRAAARARSAAGSGSGYAGHRAPGASQRRGDQPGARRELRGGGHPWRAAGAPGRRSLPGAPEPGRGLPAGAGTRARGAAGGGRGRDRCTPCADHPPPHGA